MAKKFYAVKKGLKPGVYKSWDECKKQIDGFSGAVFKGFATREEADRFINGDSSGINDDSETDAIAYVDGSFDACNKAFSYGMVLFHKGEELHFAEKYEKNELASMHNVAGEIKGAEAAMRYCLENGIKSIAIYHDYAGIEKWCTGEWQAKKPGTIAYAQFFEEVSRKVRVSFVKVKGHSGVQYNELADKLAKEALGIV